MQVWKIEWLLIKNVSNGNVTIKAMTFEMKKKFDKYWGEYIKTLTLKQGTSIISFASGHSSAREWLIMNISLCFLYYFIVFTLTLFYLLLLTFFYENNVGVYIINMIMKICQMWVNLNWTFIWKSKNFLLNIIQIWIFCNIGRRIKLGLQNLHG